MEVLLLATLVAVVSMAKMQTCEYSSDYNYYIIPPKLLLPENENDLQKQLPPNLPVAEGGNNTFYYRFADECEECCQSSSCLEMCYLKYSESYGGGEEWLSLFLTRDGRKDEVRSIGGNPECEFCINIINSTIAACCGIVCYDEIKIDDHTGFAVTFPRDTLRPLFKRRSEGHQQPLLTFYIDYDDLEESVNSAHLGGVVSVVAILIIVIAVLLCFMLLVYSRKKFPKRGKFTVNNEAPSNDAEYADIGPEISRTNNIQSEDERYCYADSEAGQYCPYEVDDAEYRVPSFTEESLYAQLENYTTFNLSRDSIKLGDVLGSGQFGEVYLGHYLASNIELNVAVKTLKEGAGEEDKVKFLQEAVIMSQFKHSHVVTMYGVVKDFEPVRSVEYNFAVTSLDCFMTTGGS